MTFVYKKFSQPNLLGWLKAHQFMMVTETGAVPHVSPQ